MYMCIFNSVWSDMVKNWAFRTRIFQEQTSPGIFSLDCTRISWKLLVYEYLGLTQRQQFGPLILSDTIAKVEFKSRSEGACLLGTSKAEILKLSWPFQGEKKNPAPSWKSNVNKQYPYFLRVLVPSLTLDCSSRGSWHSITHPLW